MIIRNAIPGEISLVSHFFFKLFESQFSFLPCTEQYFMHAAMELFDDPAGSILYIAEEDGRICGTICVIRLGEHDAQLRLFGTDPAFQGKGMGRALMAVAMTFCAEKGYTHVILWTIDICKAARHLYAENGFIMTDTKPNTTWADYFMTEEKWEKN